MRRALEAPCGAALALLGLAVPAAAVDLNLSTRGEVSYESNVFGSAQNEVDDEVLRFRPRAELIDRDGDLTWRFFYQPSYRYFRDTSSVRGWDHDLSGNFEWRISPTWTLEASDRFARVDSLSRFIDQSGPDFGDAVLDSSALDFEAMSRRTKRNRFDGTLTWQMAADKTWILGVDHNVNRGDNQLLRTTLQYIQQVSARNALGGGFSFSQNDVGSRTDAPDRQSRFYNLFGTWRHVFDPTLEFSVSAGPTLVDGDEPQSLPDDIVALQIPVRREMGQPFLVDASTCPVVDGVPVLSPDCELLREGSLPSGQVRSGQLSPAEANALEQGLVLLSRETSQLSSGGAELNFFANASVTKRWETWLAELAYRRQESTSSGFGSSTIADIVSLRVSWTPSQRWDFDLFGAWTRRDQATDTIQTFVRVEEVGVVLPCNQFFLGFCVAPNRPLLLEGAARNAGFRALQVTRNIETVTYAMRLRARYKLRKNVYLIGRFTWTRQEVKDDLLERGNVDRFVTSFGVEYRFDPIHL